MKLLLHESLVGVVRLGWRSFCHLTHAREDAASRLLEEAARGWFGRAKGLRPAEFPAVARTRRLYKAIGLDPTRHRPSSEALLRRVIQGKPLPHIHPIVDAVNAVSLGHQVSMGLYDRSRLEGDEILVRIGEAGEEYAGIGRGVIHLHNRLCLCDERGPFGNPTADSDRTKIRLETREVLVVTFHPGDETEAEIEAVAEGLEAAFLEVTDRTPLGGGRI